VSTINFNDFEEQIGYKFKNKMYLERALTHSSYNKEKNTKHQDNERLEFLGDSFLDAIISEELFQEIPQGS
jgi:ribonuclease-3